MPRRLHRPSRHTLLAVLGGLMVAAALPPWGFWPLAFVGVAVYETAAQQASTGRQRAVRGWLFGAAWLFPGMCWMWFLSAPGYLLAAAMFAGLHALAAWVAPLGPWRVIGRPAAHTLAEALRFVFPFGGVPLASMAIGQAASPFADVVRVGGALLLTWFVFQVGFALAGPSPVVPALARKRGVTAKGEWHGIVGFIAAMVVWLVLPGLADGTHTTDVKQAAATRVAAVQGGGPQGTHAAEDDTDEEACRRAGETACTVFERHLAATATIEPGSVDLVVWPENVIDVDVIPFADSPQLAQVAAEAKRVGAPFAVGITEDTTDGRHFVNAQVVVTPEGDVVSRYVKVRRVPFGEYMPMRGLLNALGAPTDLVPRDAVAGIGPPVLDAPGVPRMGVAISWEIFFGDRVNEAIEHGANFVINPTNGSSYTWTVLQSQQIASSRLRALEQNRWVVQVAPTGFSAFISPEGDVYDRTAVSEQKVIYHDIPGRGWIRTWYSHTGDLPWVVLMALLLALSQWRSRRSGAAAISSPAPESASAAPPH